MPKKSKIRRILNDKTNTSEYISDTEEDGDNLEDEGGKNDSGGDSESSFMRRRKHRSKRLPSYSDDSDQEHSEISVDATNWVDITGKSSPGIMSLNTIFRTVSGPTSYAKRKIIKGNVFPRAKTKVLRINKSSKGDDPITVQQEASARIENYRKMMPARDNLPENLQLQFDLHLIKNTIAECYYS